MLVLYDERQKNRSRVGHCFADSPLVIPRYDKEDGSEWPSSSASVPPLLWTTSTVLTPLVEEDVDCRGPDQQHHDHDEHLVHLHRPQLPGRMVRGGKVGRVQRGKVCRERERERGMLQSRKPISRFPYGDVARSNFPLVKSKVAYDSPSLGPSAKQASKAFLFILRVWRNFKQ